MDATAHPLWMPHALWGFALAAVAAALMIVARDVFTRRRLRFTLLVALAFLGLHGAMVSFPLAGAEHRALMQSLEAMLLALAITNTIVTLVFNPWVSQPGRDRAPSIIQDVLVVALIGGVAYNVFGEKIVGPSIGAAAALALGLQDQLGNLFAGLAIQIERPFRVGHWISLGSYEGRVIEVTWRATKIRTKAGNLVIIPNNTVGREAITNFSEPTAPTRLSVDVGAAYGVPPNEVRDALMTAMGRVSRVLTDPAPDAMLVDFGGSAIVYRARFWIDDFERDTAISSEVRSAIYYELNRRGIEIPWPIQIQYERHETVPDPIARRQQLAAAIAKVPVLAALPAEAHEALAASTTERLFADGEAIVREGEAGRSMFIVRRGRVAITIGADHREVAVTEAGGFFGEMSLLTGDPRTATVVARGDCNVLEIDAEVFRVYVQNNPAVIEGLAEAAAARRKALAQSRASVPAHQTEPRSLARRMRQFFGLE
ncbi:MAG TPA: cyclic nucleotide-binding domain-containing protein [Vicinamibacterales bacterium]|nr:cyclic nucleotide-binding domain-containing protein [Vicinamibacterales bacterium]